MRRQAGFTLVELITVMILIGVLAAIGIPRLMNRNDSAALVYGDKVVSALRLAQKMAVAHRRLVCVTPSDSSMVLRVAAASPATDCANIALEGVGDDEFRSGADGVTSTATAARLFFQPDGTIARDGQGTNRGRDSVAIVADGQTVRTIRIEGTTGYVE